MVVDVNKVECEHKMTCWRDVVFKGGGDSGDVDPVHADKLLTLAWTRWRMRL
jgi:hypothetical protein